MIVAELLASDLPSIHGALKVIGQMTAFVKAMTDLMEDYEDLKLRFERLQQEQEEVCQREEAARRKAHETADTLAKLRLAYEALIIEHEVGKGAFQNQEQDDKSHEGEEAAEALAELRLAYEALIVEHDLGRREFDKLQAEHDALLEGRRQIVEELGAVMSALRTGRGSGALGAPAAEA